ncbi:hypothetical protein Nmel_001604 [Mimus melanotis]
MRNPLLLKVELSCKRCCKG